MELQRIKRDFSVCKVTDYSKVNLESEYCFIGKTDEENSLVCLTEDAPDNTTEREDGWRAFRIQGVLDFSLIGILAKISTLLAKEKFGIFVVSTYNTDYILVKKENEAKALKRLVREGYKIEGEESDDQKADGKLLLLNLDRLHTTPMGADRIKKNLRLETADVVEYCRDKILSPDCNIYKQGKNWYCQTDNVKITVNASSCTIITAHLVKE